MKFSPITQKRIERFRKHRRGMISLVILTILVLIAIFANLIFNNKALIVKYEGSYYFPAISKVRSGKEFGLPTDGEPSYKKLQKKFESEKSGNWVMMPLIPYGDKEYDDYDKQPYIKKNAEIKASFEAREKALNAQGFNEDSEEVTQLRLDLLDELKENDVWLSHPLPPDWSRKHILGTDVGGRDILGTIFYGFRIAFAFAMVLLFINYTIGMTIGCLMGYLGGWFDLCFQRLIEILSNIPFLYIVIIMAAAIMDSPVAEGEEKIKFGFWHLVGIFSIFGWMGITWYVRTYTYREKSRDYINAARAMGAGNMRIVFSHLVPNMMGLVVTFIPFAVSGSIVSLTSLDFLGYGLPKGDASWGNLIKQGTEKWESYWIVLSIVGAMVIVLFLINSIGEALRDAFDPKKISTYE